MSIEERNWRSIVITGGPCGGKSSSMAYLSQKLSERGYRVLIGPETATFLHEAGVSDLGYFAEHDRRTFFELERQMILLHRNIRKRLERTAELFAPQPVAILFDRGEMDAQAYLGAEGLRTILEEEKLTFAHVRDSYDAVVHLVTAADGAAEFYTNANNPARRETAQEAIDADRRTLAAWSGHPKLTVADNAAGFDTKLHKTLSAVLHCFGQDGGTPEHERKFLLARVPDLGGNDLDAAVVVDIEQIYLHSDDPDVERRIRRRGQGGQATYFYTEKRRVAGIRMESERRISPSEFFHLRADADPAYRVVHKRRVCFVHASQYCELDLIDRPDGTTLAILEIETEHADTDITVPEFLSVDREVTDDPGFSNAHLARR